MSSRLFRIVVSIAIGFMLSIVCACGDGMMTDEQLMEFEDELEYRLDDVDLNPVADPDQYVDECEPGWDGC